MGAAHGGVDGHGHGHAQYPDAPDDDGFLDAPVDDFNGTHMGGGRYQPRQSSKDGRRSPGQREPRRRPMKRSKAPSVTSVTSTNISSIPSMDEDRADAVETYFRARKSVNGYGPMPENFDEACAMLNKQDQEVLDYLADWNDNAHEQFSLLDSFQIGLHFQAQISLEATFRQNWKRFAVGCVAFVVLATTLFTSCFLAVYSLKDSYVDSNSILRNWDGLQVETLCSARQGR